MDFERFRPILERAADRARGPKGGRPSFDVVLKFRMLVLQSIHGLSLDATERMVRDRLSWMRFCGLGIVDTVPDANTLWDFREALIQTANTERRIWADTAYRSAENEAWLVANGMVSEIHRKKPRDRPMTKRTSIANGRKSVVRSKIEHVFGHQKDRMGRIIRTIGLVRAKATITSSNRGIKH